MEFRKYDKVHRLGKEETDGILLGTVHVEEKVDGANLSIWLGSGGEIRVGSRNNDLTANGNEFNGAVKYVNTHPGIKKFFEENNNCRLYGEWLVKHTIEYNPTAYKKFYLFDIFIESEIEAGEDTVPRGFLNPQVVHDLANQYGIDVVPYLGKFENPTFEELKKLMGASKFGDRGEGIVLKNVGFKNTFGDFCYAKIVDEAFKEDNGITFGGNNKFSDTYWEVWIMNKFIDVPRVQKIMNKIQPMVNERMDMKHIPRVMHAVYHDMITEEAWTISQKARKIDFDALQRVCYKKIKQVYVSILNDSISVADVI